MSMPSGRADSTGNVGCSEVELRSVTGEEGLLTAAFLFSQNVNLTYKLCVGMNGAGLAENLSSFDLILVQYRGEEHQCCRRPQRESRSLRNISIPVITVDFFSSDKTNDFNCISHLNCTTLNSTCSNCTTTCDGEYVLNRHKEGLVSLTVRSRNVGVNSVHELVDASIFGSVRICWMSDSRATRAEPRMIGISSPGKSYSERSSRISISTRSRSSSSSTRSALVHEYNDCRNANLTREKDVFTSLLHRTVGSSNNEDSAVHLSSTGDHVLNVVGVTGAVNVSIVTCFSVSYSTCLVLIVIPRASFFGSVIDLVVSDEFDVAVCKRKNLCDSSGKSCLAVVNVTDGTNVYMGLGSFKLCLCHWNNPPKI